MTARGQHRESLQGFCLLLALRELPAASGHRQEAAWVVRRKGAVADWTLIRLGAPVALRGDHSVSPLHRAYGRSFSAKKSTAARTFAGGFLLEG